MEVQQLSTGCHLFRVILTEDELKTAQEESAKLECKPHQLIRNLLLSDLNNIRDILNDEKHEADAGEEAGS